MPIIGGMRSHNIEHDYQSRDIKTKFAKDFQKGYGGLSNSEEQPCLYFFSLIKKAKSYNPVIILLIVIECLAASDAIFIISTFLVINTLKQRDFFFFLFDNNRKSYE